MTAQLAPNDSSYIVIVTRGHRDDMRVLRWAAQTPARYIGMIGSKRKTIAIYKELEKEGIAAGEACARPRAGRASILARSRRKRLPSRLWLS